VKDSEVVKVLAKFMFRRAIKFGNEILCYSTDDENEEGIVAPLYLTDYNAIAEVWRKAWGEHGIDVNLPCDYDGCTKQWFNATPSEHAYALAKAILEARKNDEPDDWVGDNR